MTYLFLPMIFLQMYDNPVQALLFSSSSIYFYYAGLHKMFVQESDQFPLYQLILLQYKLRCVSSSNSSSSTSFARTLSRCICSVLHSMRHYTRLHGNRKQIHMDFKVSIWIISTGFYDFFFIMADIISI